ncbi:carboxymuconolactone decarboxylase family protein [Erwinia piriflorinigrans]|uniref:Carboxymuconolactone decarboxylase-like domain-containing protein n=1 Tax=Erwinia piriflorinigrans CFBP 5888 TaxID=1161919 RepID=V5ZDI6_9GAMM|nr:carboxymuconolactone decarboxylase family protein [Erwinia piriflorinigrans]CCG89149.1 hypothetical protein EPIR_3786 [Erwinia piriflorinigrans CFBP 5888]
MNEIDNQRLMQGMKAIEKLELPLGHQHGLLHGMRLQAPAFKQHFMEELGAFFAEGQGIDDKTRTLLALVLACGSATPPAMLEFCTAAALKHGWQRDQLVNALELTALFNGWPAAIAATQTVIATFTKLDEEDARHANR